MKNNIYKHSILINDGKPYTSIVYGIYQESTDITIIFKDTYIESNCLISTEITGFYYGRPNEKDIEKFHGKLKAEF